MISPGAQLTARRCPCDATQPAERGGDHLPDARGYGGRPAAEVGRETLRLVCERQRVSTGAALHLDHLGSEPAGRRSATAKRKELGWPQGPVRRQQRRAKKIKGESQRL
eukprot:scaffold243383_cov27-Tisochrysis_lutea.AAC.6